MKKNLKTIILLLIIFAIGVASYFVLPDKVPLQWGLSGEVNRYGGKLEASALLPIIALLLVISNLYKGKEKDNRKSDFVLLLLIIVQLIILGLSYFAK